MVAYRKYSDFLIDDFIKTFVMKIHAISNKRNASFIVSSPPIGRIISIYDNFKSRDDPA